MAMIQYIFHRGEPIAFGDRIESGAVLGGHSMRARMKPVQPQHRDLMPGPGVLAVMPRFGTVFVAEAGASAAYWLHSLTAAESAGLAAGDYLADSALLLGNAVVWISEPVRIVLRDAASSGG